MAVLPRRNVGATSTQIGPYRAAGSLVDENKLLALLEFPEPPPPSLIRFRHLWVEELFYMSPAIALVFLVSWSVYLWPVVLLLGGTMFAWFWRRGLAFVRRHHAALRHLRRGELDEYRASLMRAAAHYQGRTVEYHLWFLLELTNLFLVTGELHSAKTILHAMNPKEVDWQITSDHWKYFVREWWSQLAVRLAVWEGEVPPIRRGFFGATAALVEAKHASYGVILGHAKERLTVVENSRRWCWVLGMIRNGAMLEHDLLSLLEAFAANEVGDKVSAKAALKRLRLPVSLWTPLGREWPALGRFLMGQRRLGSTRPPLEELQESEETPRSAAVGGSQLLHRG